MHRLNPVPRHDNGAAAAQVEARRRELALSRALAREVFLEHGLAGHVSFCREKLIPRLRRATRFYPELEADLHGCAERVGTRDCALRREACPLTRSPCSAGGGEYPQPLG